MDVTFRQLEYVVAVAETLNFRRAAAACFVSQPALSEQLRLFETRVGHQVFERNQKRVMPTPIGNEIIAHARLVLAAMRDLAEAAKVHGEPLSGRFTLGVIPTVAPYVLPRLLAMLRKKHPRLRLVIREETTERLVQSVQRGDCDVLLLALEADLADLETRPLYPDAFLAALPANHVLATRSRLSVDDLEGADVLLLEDGHCLRDQALAICRKKGVREMEDLRSSSLATLLRMVEGGMGVTLLPELARSREVGTSKELTVVPFKEAPHRTIGLAWRRSSPRQRDIDLLAPICQAARPR